MNDMSPALAQLTSELSNKSNIWILTGAGISAPSGIPTYRDHQGKWQAANPIQHGDFIKYKTSRQRYWARSMVGWKPVRTAQPNAAHRAVTQLQQSGLTSQIVTQNVDCLHSTAGTHEVIDLHGRLDQIVCLDCGEITGRAAYQPRLITSNPQLGEYVAKSLPDGDASVENFDVQQVEVPPCECCGGTLKPHVVFFGGTVPRTRVDHAFNALQKSDCVLIIGSSLTVYSGFRFAGKAHAEGIPLYAINQGKMRGEELFTHIAAEPCERALPSLTQALTNSTDH